MYPVFDKGFLVIVEQIHKNYDVLQVGDIIAYPMRNTIVVHRIVNIEEVSGEFYFYTKGDANSYEDNYKIPQENIVGLVRVAIPYIGYPTVWLSEL